MAPRVLTGLAGVPLVLGAIWAGYPLLTVLVGAAATVGLVEFYRMSFGPAPSLLWALGALWAGLFVVGGQVQDNHSYAPYAVLGAGLVVALPWLLLNLNRSGSLSSWARGIGGPIYVGFLLAHAVMLREWDGGSDVARDWLLFAVVVVFATDTGAFLVGRVWGRHRMAPSVSPGKTWEGAFGGMVSALGVAAALGALLQLSVPLWQAVVVVLPIAVVAQLGDLFESRLKRASGVKDAGFILPGHGGILDRLDSILIALPVTYYLVTLVLNPSD